MPITEAQLKSIFIDAAQVPQAFTLPPQDGSRYLVNNQVISGSGTTHLIDSPLCLTQNGQAPTRPVLGHCFAAPAEVSQQALEAALAAWDNGRGAWPTMSVAARVERLEEFCRLAKPLREEVARILMWEIAKPWDDSLKEFDRTLEYITDTISALKELDRKGCHFEVEKGVVGMVRRAPLGVVLCMGPYNYPLNETYTTLIPALIMGNVSVVKLPKMGVLCHMPLLSVFAKCFPAGVVNILAGDGEQVVGPLMKSGKINVLAFIGSSKVADILKHQHPKPHRLRSVLGLDAKNPGIILEDADLDLAVRESVKGALSFNGQRCTALKILFVHKSRADQFVQKLSDAVELLKFGMPWEKGVTLTPMAEKGKTERLSGWLEDAKSKGAVIANPSGGKTYSTFFFPAVVYGVTSAMQMYHVEQFGPIVPVVSYQNTAELYDYVEQSAYGQQISLFGNSPSVIGPMLDILANQVCRINLNTQCQRGPDAFPFTGRKDSAEGTLSVSDALRVFSIRSMVAASYDQASKTLLTDIVTGRSSHFLRTDYLL
jgi:glyceraldehyde-3-phosphate dehydrogenase (NADP+)